ncbi:SET domain-containing protein [Pantoea sp. RIT413]|uniref:SET domain-containing protein n=1 Tax=Pantoea sp. RIT413 TaxID=2202162 RepID=UPI0011BFE03F|nr:SET domain-containing protein [Pantoea sp. RIT 413]
MPIGKTSSDYRRLNQTTEQFNQQCTVNTPQFNRNVGKSPRLQDYSHKKQSGVVKRMAADPGNHIKREQAQTLLCALTTITNISLPAPPPAVVHAPAPEIPVPKPKKEKHSAAGEESKELEGVKKASSAETTEAGRSGADLKSEKPLLLTAGSAAAIGAGSVLPAARRPGPLSAVISIGARAASTAMMAGATYMGYHYFSERKDNNAPPITSAAAENVNQTSDFIALRSALASNLAAVIADESGHIQVQSLGDRLCTLHEIHGDTPAFIAEARALLQANGLLAMLDQLLPSQTAQSKEVNPTKETAGRGHVRQKRSATDANTADRSPATTAAELTLLNSLITSPAANVTENEDRYFTAWRNSLPRGETFSWLKNAPEDRQRAYKKLLDYVATSEAGVVSSLMTVLAEQPGTAQLSQRLQRQQHLPVQPEEIILHASINEKAGTLSAPVAVSLTLNEAWQTGMLDKMLASGDLKVDLRSQRRLLQGTELAAFRTALHGIPAPPDVVTLNQDDRIRLAFRHLTEARFELSTLEAELKGDLRSNDHIRGLQIVSKFRNGAADVEAGNLTFSALDASGRAFSVPLSGWLVLRDNDGSCVLYDADISARSHYFSSEQAMMQFVSETAMRDTVGVGRLETAAMAEGTSEAFHLSEFFRKLENNPTAWSSSKAALSFTPSNNTRFDETMSAFADRLQMRNNAILAYDASIQDAAARVVNLNENWVSAMRQHGMPSLLEYTRAWMKTRDEYGKFLQEKQVINNTQEFDPDKIIISPPGGKNIGTLTEFAAYLRRKESNSADFTRNMEILPIEVFDNTYVSALTRTQKIAFTNTLSRMINMQGGGNPSTADEHYISTLKPDSQQSLHTAMQMYLRLNQQDVKDGLDSALKAGYPGTSYQQYLRQKIDLTLPQNRKLREAWNMVEVAKMQLALKATQKNSQQGIGGVLPADDARRIEQLLAGFPGSTTSRYDFMAPLTVGNVRIPGMVIFTLRDGYEPRTGSRVRPRQYIYTPEAIHGSNLFEVNVFNNLIKRSQIARSTVKARAALADTDKLDETFEAMLRGASPAGARAGYALVNHYDLYSEMIEKRIADSDAKTISRWEVIRDATMTGVGAMVLPACLASGPAAAVMCAGLTAGTLINDGYEAVKQWSRGARGEALMTGLIGMMDVADITSGLRTTGRTMGIARKLGYAVKQTPDVLKGVAGGAQGLLNRLKLKTFSSVADAANSAGRSERHSGAFDAGWLKREWAINVDLSEARRVTPSGAPAGAFYEQNGRTYIKERGYEGEMPMVYRVEPESGGVVRVVNPAHPGVPGDRIRWNSEHWVKDLSGLQGGGNDVGTFNPQIDEMYAIRDKNNRPLYISKISDVSVNSQSGTVYSSESVLPFINNKFMNRPDPIPVNEINNERKSENNSAYKQIRKALYENNIDVRIITAKDVPENEQALIGQFGGFAAKDIKKGEAIGVYGGRVVSKNELRKDEFIMNAFQAKSAPGDTVRLLHYSGDNSISRINTIYEADNGVLKQARTGYNAEAASFDITALNYDPRRPTLNLRLVVLYATEDIPKGKELRWNYGYSSQGVKESITR